MAKRRDRKEGDHDARMPNGPGQTVHTTAHLLELHEDGVPMSMFCTLCKGSSRNLRDECEAYCLTCYELMCESCSKQHSRLSSSRKHLQTNFNPKTLGTMLCRVHEGRFVEQFCIDCATPVCKVCTHTSHSQHSFSPFRSLKQMDKRLRKAVCEFLEGSLDDMIARREEIRGIRLAIINNRKETKRAITQRMWNQLQIIQETLQAQERQLHEEVDEYFENISSQCEEMEKLTEESVVELTKLCTTAQAFATPLEGIKKITCEIFPMESMQRSFTKTNLPATILPRKDFDDLYTPGEMTDLGSIESLADDCPKFDVVVKKQLRNQNQLLWQDKSSNRTVDLCFLQTNITNILNTQYAISKKNTVFKIGNLDIRGNAQSLPTPTPDTSEDFCTIGNNYRATCAAVLTKGEGKGWDVMLLEKQSLEGIYISSSDTESAGDPVSLAISLAGNIIIATIEDADGWRGATSLRCYNHEGTLLWCRDTSSSTGLGKLLTPWSVCVDPLDRIIVADTKGCCVKIFDCQGNHLNTFCPTPYTKPRPSSVTTDIGGRIYVAFYEQKLVSLFTPNGQFIRHVLRTEAKPKAISVLDNHIIVATEEALEMYQMRQT